MVDTKRLIEEAHANAQRAFHAMLDARTWDNPHAPETKAYVESERAVDDLIRNAQWERVKSEFDALQAADLAEWTEGELAVGFGK